jgi:hypothetical protein
MNALQSQINSQNQVGQMNMNANMNFDVNNMGMYNNFDSSPYVFSFNLNQMGF